MKTLLNVANASTALNTCQWRGVFNNLCTATLAILSLMLLHHDLQSETTTSKIWQHHANHDPLTGIENRHLFMSKLESESVRSKRMKHVMSVAIVDIDYFKR